MGEGWLVLGFVVAVIASTIAYALWRQHPELSIVSEAERERERPETAQPLRQLTRQDLHRMQLRHIRNALRKRQEVRKRDMEVMARKAERDITERMERALFRYKEIHLGYSKDKITDTLIVDVQGVNTKKGFARLAEIEREVKAKHTPVDPKIAKMEPVPQA